MLQPLLEKKLENLKKFECIESTIDFEIDGWCLRLWINQINIPENHQPERKIVNEIFKWYNKAGEQTIMSMIKYLEKIPNVNAIQVRSTGNPCFGTMVYTVPF